MDTTTERGAKPSVPTLGAGRSTGKVCPGGFGLPEWRGRSREPGRRPPGLGSLRVARSESGRGPGRRQGVKRSLPLCDSRGTWADASADAESSAAKREASRRETALPRLAESENSLAQFRTSGCPPSATSTACTASSPASRSSATSERGRSSSIRKRDQIGETGAIV